MSIETAIEWLSDEVFKCLANAEGKVPDSVAHRIYQLAYCEVTSILSDYTKGFSTNLSRHCADLFVRLVRSKVSY